jgi:hypothetical protein
MMMTLMKTMRRRTATSKRRVTRMKGVHHPLSLQLLRPAPSIPQKQRQ